MTEHFKTLCEVLDLAQSNGFNPICAIVVDDKPSKLPLLALPIGSFDLTKQNKLCCSIPFFG